jgi:putative restriction endonuclease
MRAYAGITDRDWFECLRRIPKLDEVNFWQPSGNREFKAILPGELFLFKLHSPNNFIVGGGIFVHFSLLPISLAWETFGTSNGANSLSEMRIRVTKYRNQTYSHTSDYNIGCILLEQPGISIIKQLKFSGNKYQMVEENRPRYGEPILTLPRLGQGAFRILVTDAYERRCTITNERTLPALDAAHIIPYSEYNDNSVSNGILLRRDLHALFDKGYITITPAMAVEVSRKIKEEFENGKDYYRLHGSNIRLPMNPKNKPNNRYLEWHNINVYRG